MFIPKCRCTCSYNPTSRTAVLPWSEPWSGLRSFACMGKEAHKFLAGSTLIMNLPHRQAPMAAAYQWQWVPYNAPPLSTLRQSLHEVM